MLVKLRRKFILIIMALVTAALAIMAGVIIYINYQQLAGDVMASVEYATTANAFEERTIVAYHRGTVWMGDGDTRLATQEEEIAALFDTGGRQFDDRWRSGGPKSDGGRARAADMVATSVYYVEDGAVTTTLVDALELSEEEANGAALAAQQAFDVREDGSDCASGHLDDQGLFFNIRETPNGMKAAFASDAYITNSISDLGGVLLLVSACVWVAFLLVSIMLARWVVRPTQRAWDQQQQFVADASHELKTPLAVMMANNSILLSHPEETVASQMRWVESSQEEARQMLELVNDMLFLARPGNAERQVVSERVDVSSLVQRNVLQFEAVCFERGIDLQADIDEDIAVMGDPNRLQRLASTLIDNACKYADSQVQVRLKREGNRAKLAITNDGATIPEEELSHVFDRFYRVDKARVRSEGGVGLGLAIAQEVAHEHGGSITATSDEARGTTFVASLPCA